MNDEGGVGGSQLSLFATCVFLLKKGNAYVHSDLFQEAAYRTAGGLRILAGDICGGNRNRLGRIEAEGQPDSQNGLYRKQGHHQSQQEGEMVGFRQKEDRKDHVQEIQEEQEGYRQSVQGRNGLCKSKIRKEDKENTHHRSQQGSDKDQCNQHGDRNRGGQSLHRQGEIGIAFLRKQVRNLVFRQYEDCYRKCLRPGEGYKAGRRYNYGNIQDEQGKEGLREDSGAEDPERNGHDDHIGYR